MLETLEDPGIIYIPVFTVELFVLAFGLGSVSFSTGLAVHLLVSSVNDRVRAKKAGV